jgi:hypothetical protein
MSPTIRMPPVAQRERHAALEACRSALEAARCARRLAAALSCRRDVWEVLQVVEAEIAAAERALARLA